MTGRGQRVVCTERASPTGESIGLFCGGFGCQCDVHQASSRGRSVADRSRAASESGCALT